MHALTELEIAPRESLGTWQDDNARGLSFAAVGAWSDAVGAFAAAAEAAASPADVASHEALALVLGNLAQACFCAGDRDEGVRHAQRVCALRVALFGEDASTVARARADLAVMLGSMGRAQEGLALIGRAISGIERSIGDEDIALVAVLENAARLAMAAGEPSTAEPYLLRLYALREAHGLSTEIAGALLSRVAASRVAASRVVASRVVASRYAATAVAGARGEDVTSADATAVDAPMVNARTVTPREAIVIEADTRELTPVESPALSSSLDLIEMLPLDEPNATDAGVNASADDATNSDDIFGSATIELVDSPQHIEPVLASPVQKELTQPLNGHSVLGFTVEYGTPAESTADEHIERIIPPPTSIRIPTPVDVAAVESPTPAGAPTLTLHVPNEPRREHRIRRPNFRWG